MISNCTAVAVLFVAACGCAAPPAPGSPANAATPALTQDERTALETELKQEDGEGAFKYQLQSALHPAICPDRQGVSGDAWIGIKDGKIVDAGFFDGSPDAEVDLRPKLAGKDAPPVPAKYERLFADGKRVEFSFSCL
jgi:hypothetical protein